MAKMLRRTLMYGLLLAAGVTLGMQLAESGTSSIYGPGFQTGGTAVNGQSIPAYAGGQLQPNGSSAWPANTAPAWNNGQGIVAAPGTQNGYGTGGNGYGTLPETQNPQTAGGSAAGTNQPDQPAQPYGEQAMQTPADMLLPPPSPPAVDRLADKTAHLLQQASQKSIHWVASLFGPGE
ncbi:hypothetical protein [Paenibacillus macerans]|uniref:hypothetical protein n=1 Tax=Paenibacillus macerans TaxID=44252 RepID=UPI003D31F032